jgi:hypothetical protein
MQKQKARSFIPRKIQQICYFAVSLKRTEITFVLAHFTTTPTSKKKAKTTCRLKLSLEKILKIVHSKKKLAKWWEWRSACCWLQHESSILLASFQNVIKFSWNLREERLESFCIVGIEISGTYLLTRHQTQS